MDIVGEVPVEIAHMIFVYLDPDDLASCSMVSRIWRERVNSDALWRPICSKEEWLPEDEDFSQCFDTPGDESIGKLAGRCFWWSVYSNLRSRVLTNWLASRHRRYFIRLQHRDPVWSCSDDTLVIGYSNGEVELYSLKATPSHLCTLQAPLDCSVSAVTHNKNYVIVQQADYLFFYARPGYSLVSCCAVSESAFSASFFEVDQVLEFDSEDNCFIDFIGAGDDTLFVLVLGGLIRITLKKEKPSQILCLNIPPDRNLYIDDNSLYIFEENSYLTVLNERGAKSMRLNFWEEIVPYKILSNETLILLLCTLANSHIIQAYDLTTGRTVYTKYTSRPFGVGLHPKKEVVVYTIGDRLTCAEEVRTEDVLWQSETLFKTEGLAQVQFSFVSKKLMMALTRADWHVYNLMNLVDFTTGRLLYSLEIEALRLVHANERMLTFFSPESRIEIITFR